MNKSAQTVAKEQASEPFTWSDAYSVGVPEVDADHMVLVELIGMIDGAASGEESQMVVSTVLNALYDYTDYHFEREERMQRAIGYPDHKEHKQGHDRLKEQVMAYLRRYQEDPAQVDIGELATFLRCWIVEHILREDAQYRPYAENNPKASEAMKSIGLDFFMEKTEDLPA
ncbi:bacteriohemerythrin [Telmatospirillum sp. J64-1]|uniref:bacteriohemerythrin n=1 Tax=Telmatospirillum sp. J64-1 TaxID=2502183 RepID=UPI00115DB1C5|nr:bacteriohemerythrin [Telmatospirillum sp. J64-1]